jgi:DNA polymerase-3 subunit alpha
MFKDYQPYRNPTLAGVRLPKIHIEPHQYEALGANPSVSNYEFLRKLCWQTIQEKGIDKLPNAKDYYARTKYELETLKELGFDEYILLNWEILNFCHENKIPTGDGRGSAAGSLVVALVNVTKLDPLQYGLFFERFVSKSRAKKIIGDDGITYLDGSLVPDIDNDIDYSRRHEVIKFIEEKHAGKTCKILTLNTLSGKACIKECLKIVEGCSEDEAAYVADSIPKKFGKVLDFEDAIKESPKFAELVKKYPKAYSIALKLEGLIKNTGVHPSGIAICHDLLVDTMPSLLTKEGELVSGYEMNDVASVAVKFDVLGLRTLTVLNEVSKATGVSLESIGLEDEETYKFLQNLHSPQGLFQIETDTGYQVCQKVRPKNINDLAAILALARPGALEFVEQYASFTNTGEFQSVHSFFDDVLKFTGGVPLYQEQLISMARKIGFTADEGEQLRRIVGKKKVEQMKEWKDKIAAKIAENKLDEKIGEILWNVAENSANYSFNASHAFSYASCSFKTAYFKVHYPQQFFLSLLRMVQHEPDPFAEIFKIHQELPLFNIRLLPPDLVKSSQDFSIEGKDLRFGLNSIKGVSEKTLSALLSFRDKEFQNKYEIFLAAKDVGLSIGILQTLIQAGCMDSFNTERCLLVLEARMFNELTEKEKIRVIEFGPRHNHNILAALKEIGEGKLLDEKSKPVISEKRLNTLREKYKTHRQIYDQNHKHKEFANWFFEKKLLGYSYSYTLRQVFQEPEHSFTPILRAKSFDDGQEVKIVGVITDSIKKKSKKGNNYMSLELSDETGRIRAMLGDSPKEKKLEKWLENNKQPEEDQIVILVGKKNKDTIFIDKLTIMDEVIAFNKKDLKE